jgi:hypothetical protein
MEQETQSEDRVEHRVSEMERFFTYQEIWYGQYIRPAIKKDVKDQFEDCIVPIVGQVKTINTRLLIKSITYGIILIGLFLLLVFK